MKIHETDGNLYALNKHLEQFEEAPDPEPGHDPGDPCNRFGCPGYMNAAEVEGCTCFISPPCNRCTSAPTICDVCEYESHPEP